MDHCHRQLAAPSPLLPDLKSVEMLPDRSSAGLTGVRRRLTVAPRKQALDGHDPLDRRLDAVGLRYQATSIREIWLAESGHFYPAEEPDVDEAIAASSLRSPRSDEAG
jgi:hypothetical protein